MSKSSLLKNARNYAEYLRKKARGPVKAFFHITKNENVPAIERQGLLTNHPNANVNSAAHPFRKHGTDAGGVWVTTEPTAFPVYGTTIGGKNGNAAARADALSTIKIEVPLPELRKMKAVQDPYGRNILRKGDDARAIEKFGTWAGIDVPTTVFLDDIKPQWLKNLGYVEDMVTTTDVATRPTMTDLAGTWDIRPDNKDFSFFNNNDFKILRSLNKGDLRDYTGYTGHRHGASGYEKSPQRYVDDYIDSNRPISERLPTFPKSNHLEYAARYQGADNGPKYIKDDIADVPAPNEANRYSADFIPARTWTEDYRDYVKPGESIKNRRQFEFAPGAISRGMGGSNMPSIKERNFDWNRYKELLQDGETPQVATFAAQPIAKLDWDNIVYHAGTYRPRIISVHDVNAVNEGAISRGMPYDMESSARMNNWNRRKAVDEIQKALKSYNESNADIVRNEYKLDMPDDEIRELSRLEMRNNKDNKAFSDDVINWSRLENSDILKQRKQALDRIKGSWLWNYLTK